MNSAVFQVEDMLGIKKKLTWKTYPQNGCRASQYGDLMFIIFEHYNPKNSSTLYSLQMKTVFKDLDKTVKFFGTEEQAKDKAEDILEGHYKFESELEAVENLLGCDGPRRLLRYHNMTFIARKAQGWEVDIGKMSCFFCREHLGDGTHWACIEEMDNGRTRRH